MQSKEISIPSFDLALLNLRALIKDEKYKAAYDLYCDSIIDDVIVDVAACGLTDLMLRNMM